MIAALLSACGGGGAFTITPTAVFTTAQEALDIIRELLDRLFVQADLALALTTELEDFIADPDLPLICNSGGTVELNLISTDTIELVFINCIDFVQVGGGSIPGILHGTVRAELVSEDPDDTETNFDFVNFDWAEMYDVDNVFGALDVRVRTPTSGPNAGDTLVDINTRDYRGEIDGDSFSFIRLFWDSDFFVSEDLRQDDFRGGYGGDSFAGVVVFDSEVPIVYDNTNEWCEQGVLEVEGDSSSLIRVTITDMMCDLAVEIDADGDGIFELTPLDWELDDIGLEAPGCS